MADITDFEFNLYGRDQKWKRTFTGLTDLDVKVIHNDAGVTTFHVPTRNPAMAQLVEPGCRMKVDFRGKHLTSGLLTQLKGATRRGRGPDLSGEKGFTFPDDFQVLKNIRAWPNPAGTAAQQGDDEAYYNYGTAPAETVLKDVVIRNMVNRLRMPVTVEPDLARGSNINIQFRMHPLYDRLFPAVDQAGIGVRVRQVEGSRLLEVYEPGTFPFVLDEENRVITEGDYDLNSPTVSRGVVGGQGQGTERTFTSFQDEAREQLWGEIWETSVDARDTDQADAYTKRALEALLEGSAKDNISLNLIEAGRFTFGGEKGIQLGDMVTAQIERGAISITDVLREVTLKWDQANGLKIGATIGVKDDPTTPIQNAIVALAKAVRDIKAGN